MVFDEVCFQGTIAMRIVFTCPHRRTFYLCIPCRCFPVCYQIITERQVFSYLRITSDISMNLMAALVAAFGEIAAIRYSIFTAGAVPDSRYSSV